MWLLDVRTLALKEFFGSNVPRYVILSHRWEQEELSFDDIRSLSQYCRGSQERVLQGYEKIKAFCAEASRNGYEYGWVDTCCIDKRSSAELSEAINSMYAWYERAEACYAYLSDVNTVDEVLSSVWFTRGWTLQELIAPRNLSFYNKHWEMVGNKSDMSDTISTLTNIPEAALLDFRPSEYSMAQRISWVAERTTTREEDEAYCLLGIVEVNMPMLYGEGKKAFRRLQDEIMKQSSDLSIFSWEGPADPGFGMLAESPQSFAMSRPTRPEAMLPEMMASGFSCHNGGIEMVLRLTAFCTVMSPVTRRPYTKVYFAILTDSEMQHTYGFRILLIHRRDNLYERIALGSVPFVTYKETSARKFLPPSRVLIQRSPLRNILSSDMSPSQIDTKIHVLGRKLVGRMPENRQTTSTTYSIRRGIPLQSQVSTDHCRWTATQVLPPRCECNIYTARPIIKESHGLFHSVTMKSPVDDRGLIGKSAGFLETTLCFGFDFDHEPICLMLPFHGPDEMLGLDYLRYLTVFHYLLPLGSGRDLKVDAGTGIVAARGISSIEQMHGHSDIEISIEPIEYRHHIRAHISWNVAQFGRTHFPDTHPLYSGVLRKRVLDLTQSRVQARRKLCSRIRSSDSLSLGPAFP